MMLKFSDPPSCDHCISSITKGETCGEGLKDFLYESNNSSVRLPLSPAACAEITAVLPESTDNTYGVSMNITFTSGSSCELCAQYIPVIKNITCSDNVMDVRQMTPEFGFVLTKGVCSGITDINCDVIVPPPF